MPPLRGVMNKIKIKQFAKMIFGNEPCLGLEEKNLRAPDHRNINRYQILYVVRNDRPAEHRIDLGLASNFTTGEFNIMGGNVENNGNIHIEHTVDEVRDMANHMREAEPFDRKELVGPFREALETLTGKKF